MRDAILDSEKITLFQFADYAGAGFRRGVGEYTYSDLSGEFIQANSLMVPFDFKVTLFTNDNLDTSDPNDYVVFTATTADLNNINIRSLKVEYLNTTAV